MENSTFLEQHKYGIGDGNLQYYVYNWKCPPIPANKVKHSDSNVINQDDSK